MKYVLLISHGQMAAGLKDSLAMLAGNREDVLAFGLENGSNVEAFKNTLKEGLAHIKPEDELIILGDLIGGSPLSTTLSAVDEMDLMDNSVVIGGMNLPLGLTCILMKDNMDIHSLVPLVLQEATGSLKQFSLENNDDQEDDI